MIFEWRGRCALKPNFLSFQRVTNEQLRDIGALLLVSELVHDGNENILDVAGAFTPLCPFLNCYRISRMHWKNHVSKVSWHKQLSPSPKKEQMAH